MTRSAWRTLWRREGYVETAIAEDADLVILNTCHIREKAAEKVYSELGRVRAHERSRRRRRPQTSSSRSPAASRRPRARRSSAAQPAVDLVVGPQSYHRLPELIARAARDGKADRHRISGRRQIRPSRRAEPRRRSRARGVTAFVTVQEGCDKFCTFCVVPYTRGAEISRPVGKIVAEVERLAAAGVREVTLIGQNVNAYHGEGPDGRPWSLARLLARVAEIARHRAAALHDQPSARHGRRSDRRASRFAAS